MASPLETSRQGAAGPIRMRERRTVTCRKILGGGSELIILHAGEEYRLRITKQNKLILTK